MALRLPISGLSRLLRRHGGAALLVLPLMVGAWPAQAGVSGLRLQPLGSTGQPPSLAQVRQAYPYPASPLSSAPYGAPQQLVQPLAVCPSEMVTFATNSSTRSVPFATMARSCDCFAQERANGASQEQSSRRCFP